MKGPKLSFWGTLNNFLYFFFFNIDRGVFVLLKFGMEGYFLLSIGFIIEMCNLSIAICSSIGKYFFLIEFVVE